MLRMLCFILLFMNSLLLFPRVAVSLDVTLKWNLDQSARGYKIYYKTGSNGPPYNGKGAYEGDSPIDVGYVSSCNVRYLSDAETHYFVATAYDDYGESGYSDEVSIAGNALESPNDGDKSYYPNQTSTNEESFSGTGGGGGCFISVLFSEPFL